MQFITAISFNIVVRYFTHSLYKYSEKILNLKVIKNVKTIEKFL